jgi:hypothetical protein
MTTDPTTTTISDPAAPADSPSRVQVVRPDASAAVVIIDGDRSLVIPRRYCSP